MTVPEVAHSWAEANQRYLSAQLARIRAVLEKHAGKGTGERSGTEPRMEGQQAAALETLCQLFDLSPFERDLLLLCAGIELEAGFAPLCAAVQGDPNRDYPTFSLALSVLPDAQWSAFSPSAPLRRWQLIRLEPGRALTRSPLRINECILHYLVGVQHLDEDLAGLLRPLPAPQDLVPSQEMLSREIAATWAQASEAGELPVVQLCGLQMESKSVIAAAVCAMLGLQLYIVPLAILPSDLGELDRLLQLWGREAALAERALLVDCDGIGEVDPIRESILTRVVEANRGPLMLSSRDRRGPWARLGLTYDVNKPTSAEQRALWHSLLGNDAPRLEAAVEHVVSQFSLNPSVIAAAVQGAWGRLTAEQDKDSANVEDVGVVLWDLCRTQSRPRLDDLAQHIEPAANWDDLVLPQEQREVLREICMHVRQQARVYDDWDFQSKSRRRLGVSALFAGLSGTGKTMAAEVLASELRLDLYRIDLSAVASKYIGETEKNLRRLFDAAEDGGAILFFDEADALFGRRSEVEDSHDRYANIEVSYLLSRMEAYRGLAILTTNLKDALDPAFLRCFRFIVQFPFPDQAEREAIWHGIFPAATPTEDLDYARLAQLNLAGGDIRNIALKAAFLAADAEEPVRMAHVLHAARNEYKKLDRQLTGAEIRGWDESER
jgi:hypothetical protein